MSETLQHDTVDAPDAFQRNLDAFREFAPRLHAILSAIERPYSRLEYFADGDLDITLGGKRLYGTDAVTYTQDQLGRYLDAPTRHFFGRPKPGEDRRMTTAYCVSLVEQAAQQGILFDEARQADDSWYTLVFGIGLGLHLQTLAEATRCRTLILVEPMVENIYHSLSVIDWREIFAPSDGTGRTVHFVMENEQEAIASNLRTIIRDRGASLLDGLYFYRHYALATLTQAEEQFHRDFYLHMTGLGFLEDELVMTANSAINLARGDLRVIAYPVPAHDTPVILCGSGPSIDGCYDQLRNLQDRAIIVSLGSCLRSLLSHGIRPDFHIEMENEMDNARNICRTDDEFGVDGITLVASTTVQPSGAKRFDDIIYYYRDRVTSSYLFGRGIDWLGSCGPTVTNAGLIAMLYLGFRKFHLFGVDMGSRDVDRYHASDTFIGMGQAREWGSGARVPVAANFGGTAYAESILRWSRMAIETVVRLHDGVSVINCSDGARIAGTVAMLPHLLTIESPSIDRAALRSRLDECLPVLGEQGRRMVWDRVQQQASLDERVREIVAVLDAVSTDAEPGIDWLKRVYDLVLYDTGSSAGPAYLFGSMTMILGVVWWHDRRVQSPAMRSGFRRLAAAQMRLAMAAASDRLTRLYDDVDDVFAGRSDMVATERVTESGTIFPMPG
jgi:hypothetical protein